MKRNIVIALILLLPCLSFYSTAQQQTQSIGLRLGAPMGVTYKRGLAANRAVEFLVGSLPNNWSKSYYINSFDSYSDFDNREYIGHRVYSTLFLQARYLLQYDIQTDISGKLRWYLGGGVMFKGSKVSYQYRVIQDPVVYSRRKNDVDLGVEAPVGVEYDFEAAPFNVFLELSPMIEIADRPGAFRVFIGLGGRYRF